MKNNGLTPKTWVYFKQIGSLSILAGIGGMVWLGWLLLLLIQLIAEEYHNIFRSFGYIEIGLTLLFITPFVMYLITSAWSLRHGLLFNRYAQQQDNEDIATLIEVQSRFWKLVLWLILTTLVCALLFAVFLFMSLQGMRS